MNPERSSREVVIHFGDVVQMGYSPPNIDETYWSAPGVVIGVEGASVSMAQAIESDGKTYLTTFGTAYGTPHHVEGAKRWTPLEVATAVTDGLWEYPASGEWAAGRAEYELAVNSLLRSLTERSKQSPWRYPLE
jgi:hypothetical protein